MSNRTETSDFWVVFVKDEDAFSEYFGESTDYYQAIFGHNPAFVRPAKKGHPRTDLPPLSHFIGDQGQDWYDHDMSEMGFKADALTVCELVKGASYSDQWAGELASRVAALGIGKVNGFCFMTSGAVAKPRSVTLQDFTVHYVGKITYRI